MARRRAARNWRQGFLVALRASGCVSGAAALAGVSRRQVYRQREQSAPFRQAWDDALAEGLDALELEARRRALAGSDILLMFLLKAERPERYRHRRDVTHVGDAVIRRALGTPQPV